MENKYKLRKVFNCQDMPQDLREKFFDLYDWCMSNDVYVSYEIAGSRYKYTLLDGTEVDDSNSSVALAEMAIDKWLIENGAIGQEDNDLSGEEVLIRRWW